MKATPRHKVIFMAFTEKSFDVTNVTTDHGKIPFTRNCCNNKVSMRDMALKAPWYFNLLMKERLGLLLPSSVFYTTRR